MNILFLCHHFPYPPDHGAKIRAYFFIRHLSQNHRVTVATLAHTDSEIATGEPLRGCCEDIIAEVVPSHARWRQALTALCTSVPSSVAYFWSPKLKRRIDEAFAARKFDIVIVFCAFMAQYVLERRGQFRVLDYGDMDSGKWAEYARYKAFPMSWGYALEAAKLRNYERKAGHQFDRCAVISQGELEEYQRIGIEIPCSVLPNGVDTEYFCMNGNSKQESSIIAFLGRMDYYPNVEGIGYFVRDVLPLIQAKKPDVHLRIVGSNPTKSVRQLAQLPNVSVTGHVSDVRESLRDAALTVAPLRIARGTQNKILESMAMGIPVVSTVQAAKGVGATPGEHFLVANGPEDFAHQVVSVLQDKELRARLAKAGRSRVEDAYVWPASLESLDAILAEAGNGSQMRLRVALG